MGCPKPTRWTFCFFYNTLLITGTLLFLPFLIYSVITQVKRRRTFRPRMGWCRYPWQTTNAKHSCQRIWVHALSVGEVQAAQPLVDRLCQIAPDYRICFSTSTLTGFQVADQLFHRRQGVDLAYFPYDWIWAVRAAASKIKPSVVILTETDIWPNFLMEMHRRNVPVYLVNLRFSDESWSKFQRFRSLARYLFSFIHKICVQSQADLNRLERLGYPSQYIAVTGNIKFDSTMPNKDPAFEKAFLRQWQISAETSIIVAGSTHRGEEALLFEMLAGLTANTYPLLLIIAPRDPRRSSEIISQGGLSGFDCQPLSFGKKNTTIGKQPDVVVVDGIGVLRKLYHLAEIAFIGGSLVASGGHNPLEPAACGKPVLFGPDMSDFNAISQLLKASGGAVQVKGGDDLLSTVSKLLARPALAAAMGQCALRVYKGHQGAVDRTLAFLKLVQTHSKGVDTALC